MIFVFSGVSGWLCVVFCVLVGVVVCLMGFRWFFVIFIGLFCCYFFEKIECVRMFSLSILSVIRNMFVYVSDCYLVNGFIVNL